jgi:hypothetical protein
MQSATSAKTSLHTYLTARQRRSVIAVLALTAGCNALVSPIAPAAGKALRSEEVAAEPEVPKYPTVNVRKPRLMQHAIGSVQSR